MAAISPRSEDVVSGGGSFSTLLNRAIRHDSTTTTTAAAADESSDEPSTIINANSGNIATPNDNNLQTGDDEEKGRGREDNNHHTEEEGREGDNTNNTSNNNNWSRHHISYELLSSTLKYFVERRALLRTKLLLRDDNTATTNNSQTGGGTEEKKKKANTNNNTNTITITEAEFNLTVSSIGQSAPFINHRNNDTDGSSTTNKKNISASYHHHTTPPTIDNNSSISEDVMEYADKRALGRTPPGGTRNNTPRRLRKKNVKKSTGEGDGDGEEDLTMAGVLLASSGVCAPTMNLHSSTDEENVPCSPYLHMPSQSTTTSSSSLLLDETEIINRLSYMERSELSALLDCEVERSSTFYRKRVSELAPPRVDGGVCPTFVDVACIGGGMGSMGGGGYGLGSGLNCGTAHASSIGGSDMASSLLPSIDNDDSDSDDELIAPPLSHQDRINQHLSFTEMGNEILELHAFITTNIIVVRQILIKYDAFVRSLGGTPMGSWYQTTRRQRGNGGRSSDYRDLLVEHSKLKRLTKAYIVEYERHCEGLMEEDDDYHYDWDHNNRDDDGGGGQQRRRRVGKKHYRLRGLSKAFYKIVDAGEEMKKRQRLKWRQSAMHLEDEEGFIGVVNDDDDDDDEDGEEVDDKIELGEGGGKEEVVAAAAEGEEEDQILSKTTSTPPTTTLIPPSQMSGTRDNSSSATLLRDLETPPPQPPLHPIPDYSTLKTNPDIGEDIAYQVHIFKCIQSKTQRSIEKTFTGHVSGMYDNFISAIREYFLVGSATDSTLSLMPEYLVMRGKSLKSSLLVVAQWREARDVYLYGADQQQQRTMEGGGFGGFFGMEGQQPPSSSSSQLTDKSFKSNFGLFLNIFACFLYMTNYYIVEPSSTRYANALGTDDAMSGLIIGAMPTAAMLSTIVYSIWSNKCYKAPLVTSGCILIAGNFLYATAYRYESITMALAGRFMTGLGGPRSMNRRYIADTTPLAQRTVVNTAFGTATALGAALGPAAAIWLDGAEIMFDLPLYGTVYFNGMTGPGFMMGILWIVFTFVLVLMFDEPERSGLEEQKRKEKMLKTQASSIMTGAEYEMSNLNAPKNDRPSTSEFNLDKSNTTAPLEQVDDATAICSISPTTIHKEEGATNDSLWQQTMVACTQITWPVRLCMFLLFSKMFTVETVISAASMLTKNRYGWTVQTRGTLGTIVGLLTIPISIFIGWLSQYREDRVLLLWLMSISVFGMALLIDITDFISAETAAYNAGRILAVGPSRYIVGYVLIFCSLQAFDGVVGSVLSKVIPTALATGTLNSGLLATIIGTFGRACGDVFITSVGYIDLRQLMNLLFVPSFVILVSNVILICYNYDSLTA